MHGLNILGITRGISQRSTQLANTHRQGGFTHDRIGPHALEQFVFGDDVPGMVEQILEDGKGFGCNPQLVLTIPEGLIAPLNAEGAKFDSFRSHLPLALREILELS